MIPSLSFPFLSFHSDSIHNAYISPRFELKNFIERFDRVLYQFIGAGLTAVDLDEKQAGVHCRDVVHDGLDHLVAEWHQLRQSFRADFLHVLLEFADGRPDYLVELAPDCLDAEGLCLAREL
jgi:hypothetical protein